MRGAERASGDGERTEANRVNDPKSPFPADAARLRSEIGTAAADSYDQVRAKELETKLRRQLVRARANERA